MSRANSTFLSAKAEGEAPCSDLISFKERDYVRLGVMR